jgi:hypothetical protein
VLPTELVHNASASGLWKEAALYILLPRGPPNHNNALLSAVV